MTGEEEADVRVKIAEVARLMREVTRLRTVLEIIADAPNWWQPQQFARRALEGKE